MTDSGRMAALARFVEGLRAQGLSVPSFDPLDGGAEARVLMLMETPSRKGGAATGLVSFDNPTPTARRMAEETARAGISREDRIVWNVVPWYVGDELRSRPPVRSERSQGALHLAELLDLLPRLELVLTLGVAAQEGWRTLGSEIPHVAAPHPSNTNLCARPQAIEEIRAALREAKRVLSR